MCADNATENRSWFSNIIRTCKRIFLILFFGQLLYIVLLKWINPPITFTQIGSVLRGEGLKRDYVDISAIHSNAGLAVIAAEDQRFADHAGFDWKSIEKAVAYNKRKPNRVRGASTLSQQTAKNVFLWQGRSWIRKGLEVYFTAMIELAWGKKRILEVYLNVAEMGKGVYGIEAASNTYFNKKASKLTRNEAAQIAAALPNPKKYSVVPKSRYVARRSQWVLRQMRNLEGDAEIEAIIDSRK